MPGIYSRIAEIAATVEADLRDLADIEFTIDSGRLYVLQSRAGKRSAAAAVRIAVDLAREGVIDPATAVSRVSREQAESLAATAGVDAGAGAVATGLGASPGVATGVAVSDMDQAMELASAGTPVVLVRPTTAPEDVQAMLRLRRRRHRPRRKHVTRGARLPRDRLAMRGGLRDRDIDEARRAHRDGRRPHRPGLRG